MTSQTREICKVDENYVCSLQDRRSRSHFACKSLSTFFPYILLFYFSKNKSFHFWQGGARNLQEGTTPLLPYSGRTLDRLNGLVAVYNHLTSNCVYEDGSEKSKPFITFDEGLEVFLGYKTTYVSQTLTHDDKHSFLNALLHPKWGLTVHVITMEATHCRYIVLRPDDVDLEIFLDEFCKSNEDTDERLACEKETIKNILATVDTEWDRKVARVLLGTNRSRLQLDSMGIDSDDIAKSTLQVCEVANEWQNAKQAAQDLVMLRLKERKRKLKETIQQEENVVKKKTGRWAQSVIDDLEENIVSNKVRLEETESLIQSDTKANKRKLNQMSKRQAQHLMEENRIKKRRLTNQGAPRLLDSEDEEFIGKSIEDKATYHGRRHSMVMYTNRRVKRRDLLNIANYRLLQKNKRLIKSSTTVYNLSKPKRCTSMQAKRHIGRGLFCCKKPPKAEDLDNENTHYQRAHVKNVKNAFFSEASKTTSHLCMMQSTDDKAYLRPGTSEGFEKTRSQKILSSTDIEHARKLPKYDWPEKLVYQTPGTHRLFTKAPAMSDTGNEILITNHDDHFVFVRPKAIVGSSGSVWASEFVHIRQEHPDVVEVDPDKYGSPRYSVTFRQTLATLHDALFQYVDMSVQSDMTRITQSKDCTHKQYEKERLDHLSKQVEKAVSSFHKQKAQESEINIFASRIVPKINQMTAELTKVKNNIEHFKSIQEVLDGNDELTVKCNDILETLNDLELPPVRCHWADLTDAGPGVGISNTEVRFRDAEIARMYNSDYRTRVHRSRGDSGQNEAERTNSAIGDAVVDGSTIEWEKIKRFDGMTREEIEKMSVKEYEEYEARRMTQNAWIVAKEVVSRIDGAPVLGQYITGCLADKPEDAFFFNRQYLLQYMAATSSSKSTTPGSGYIEKILEFISTHYSFGELYMDYLKLGCKEKAGEPCEFCCKHSWIGPQMSRIPQPVPDNEKPGHYMAVEKTPLVDDKGQPRQPDDWQPRANIIKKFKAGEMSADTPDKVQDFANTFCVEPKHVESYLSHLQNLRHLQTIRTQDRVSKRRDRACKDYSDYDWLDLVLNGKLGTLILSELDKYLEYNKLSKKGTKSDKIKAISCDVLRKTEGKTAMEKIREAENSDSESETSDSEDDVVLEEVGNKSDNDICTDTDANESGGDDDGKLIVTTRSGRVAGSWRLLYV
ncbi:uncharacterized protein [Ptychodera flava]|uniref:uncharacterized protein n=1 Tax=Ptychodera flava TaxID=63121 RepID=UPI003969F58E